MRLGFHYASEKYASEMIRPAQNARLIQVWRYLHALNLCNFLWRGRGCAVRSISLAMESRLTYYTKDTSLYRKDTCSMFSYTSVQINKSKKEQQVDDGEYK